MAITCRVGVATLVHGSAPPHRRLSPATIVLVSSQLLDPGLFNSDRFKPRGGVILGIGTLGTKVEVAFLFGPCPLLLRRAVGLDCSPLLPIILGQVSQSPCWLTHVSNAAVLKRWLGIPSSACDSICALKDTHLQPPLQPLPRTLLRTGFRKHPMMADNSSLGYHLAMAARYGRLVCCMSICA